MKNLKKIERESKLYGTNIGKSQMRLPKAQLPFSFPLIGVAELSYAAPGRHQLY